MSGVVPRGCGWRASQTAPGLPRLLRAPTTTPAPNHTWPRPADRVGRRCRRSALPSATFPRRPIRHILNIPPESSVSLTESDAWQVPAGMPEPGSLGDRTPPQDMAAEQSVLGAMMISKDAIADVAEVLRGADFYRPSHETIHDAIIDLYGRGEPADMVTVANELQRKGELQRIGGAPYLHTITSSVPIAANASYYAGIVREKAILRRLVDAGTRIVQFGYAGEGDVDDLVDQAQAEVYQVTDKRNSEDYAPLSEIMDGVLDEIEAIGNRDAGLYGVPTGFADLDDLTNGLHAGQMIIVAAQACRRQVDDRPGPVPGRVDPQQPDQRLLQPGDDQVRDHHAAALGRGEGAAQPHPQRPAQRGRLDQAGPQDGRGLQRPGLHRRLAQHDDDGDPRQGAPAQAAPRPAAGRHRLHAADDLRQEGRVPPARGLGVLPPDQAAGQGARGPDHRALPAQPWSRAALRQAPDAQRPARDRALWSRTRTW